MVVYCQIPKRRGGAVTTSESEGDNASDSDSAYEHEETIADKRQKIRSKAFATLSNTSRSSRYRKIVGESSQSDGPGPSK